MKNLNVHHELIFKNVIIISFAYTFAPVLCICYISTSVICLLCVCVLSYKIYCAYTPSNGAMALLNKISVFRIPTHTHSHTLTHTHTHTHRGMEGGQQSCDSPVDMKKGIRNFPLSTRLRSDCNVLPSKGRAPHTNTYSTTPKL